MMSQLYYGNSLLAWVTRGRMERLQRVEKLRSPSDHWHKTVWLHNTSSEVSPLAPHQAQNWFQNYSALLSVSERLCPLYLSNLLQLHRPNSSVSLRSSSTQKLAVPSSRTKTYGDRAFSVYAAQLWNHLPSTIFSSPSVYIFKNCLETHLFVSHFEWKTL